MSTSRNKRRTKAQEVKSEVITNMTNEINIDDLAAIESDMKKLAMEENVLQPNEDTVIVETVEENVDNGDATVTEDTNVVEEEVNEVIENKEDDTTVDIDGVKEMLEEMDKSEEVSETASKESEVNNEVHKEEPKPKKRMTYEDMFGYNWMGYGYNE